MQGPDVWKPVMWLGRKIPQDCQFAFITFFSGLIYEGFNYYPDQNFWFCFTLIVLGHF
jgi:hypothetical protein